MKTSAIRKALAGFIACSLALSTAIVARADGLPDTNVLSGLVATGVAAASTDYSNFGPYTFTDGNYSGQALTDGDTQTNVSICNLFSQSFGQPNVKSGELYDLGSLQDISKVAVYADTSTLYGVKVYVGEHEGDLAAASNLAVTLTTSQINQQVAFSPRTGRYILFMFTDVAGNAIAHVAELQAFGTASSAVGTIGFDNISHGLMPAAIKVTGANGDLSQLTDVNGVGNSIKAALTDGLTSGAPGSNGWQWDGKIWTGTNGLTYVIEYQLAQPSIVSRFTFSTPAGTEPSGWSVYLSSDPNNPLGAGPAAGVPGGSSQTFDYSCTLDSPQKAQYITFVVKAQAGQDAIFPSELQIYGGTSGLWNVADHATYNGPVTPMFENATAALSKDGGSPEPYTSGTPVTADGVYVLTATDAAGKVSTVHFTIDTTAPLIEGVTDGATYTGSVTPAFSDTTAVTAELTTDYGSLTAYSTDYVSGTPITDNGSYMLKATDAAGNVTTVHFTLDIPNGGTSAATYAYYRGVNLPTAGFASQNLPGVEGLDYDWNSEADYQYFTAKGFNVFRVALTWERLQPTAGGDFDQTYLNGLIQNIIWAKKHHAKVIIDIHNYGRYDGNIINGDGSPVTSADFNNLWLRLSNLFKNDSGIYAYDLMNEPHDMGSADWHAISQSALLTIRNNGDHHLIMVPGDHWEGAGDWLTYNPTPWITDPDNNFEYQAHEYFDSDSSGTYPLTYDQELALNPDLPNVGAERLKVFADWCKQYHVKGYLGEFGVPNTDSRWLTVLDNFMKVLDQSGMDATYWAAGDRWGSYPLSVEPSDNYTTDALQMSVLLDHLSLPVVGVLNGAVYGAAVTPTFSAATITTATLSKDGGSPAAYASGTLITADGSYALAMTDTTGKVTTVSFIIDTMSPVVSGVSNGAIYNTTVTPAFSDATATVATLSKDGGSPAAYAGGTPVSVAGSYVLQVTDAAGNVTMVHFTVDTTAPAVSGITDGATYSTTVTPTFSDSTAVAATLSRNGASPSAYASGAAITADGSYVLIVTDAAGNATRLSFSISAQKAPALTPVGQIVRTVIHSLLTAVLGVMQLLRIFR